MTGLVAVLTVVVVLLAVLVVSLLRSHAEILRRLHELGAGVYADDEAGAPAAPPIRTRDGVPEPRVGGTDRVHDIAGRSPAGNAIRVGVVGTEGLTLLAFLTSGCAVCGNFWSAFADPEAVRQAEFAGRVVVITKGPEAESAAAVAALAPPGLTTVMSTEAWSDHDVPVAPYFLLIDGVAERVVGEGAASSWPQVASLLSRALADTGHGTDGAQGRAARRRGRARAEQADDVLRRAGIEPGDASLHPPKAGEP